MAEYYSREPNSDPSSDGATKEFISEEIISDEQILECIQKVLSAQENIGIEEEILVENVLKLLGINIWALIPRRELVRTFERQVLVDRIKQMFGSARTVN